MKSESKFNDIGELVHFLLKNNYRGSLSEKPVYDYLSELGFYRKEKVDSRKKLKGDILYKGLISVNKNYGKVSLK